MSEATKCFYCYEQLQDGSDGYHKRCSLKLFGTEVPPKIDFGRADIEKVATGVISRRLALTGVQPKLSLDFENPPKKTSSAKAGDYQRLTIVGLWGRYILKPPHPDFPGMPELEDVSMHLAAAFGIDTALHGLIRLNSGEFAYISRRFDRVDGKKLPLEDMCQLTERLTGDKYNSSMETIGKAIKKFSSNTGNDLVSFLQVVLLSYLIGNTDMHLKNFSLLTREDREIILSPAYDLVATKLILPEDEEESALTINGKKSNLKIGDFVSLSKNLGINDKVFESLLKKLKALVPAFFSIIDKSFLGDERKSEFKKLIDGKSAVLFR